MPKPLVLLSSALHGNWFKPLFTAQTLANLVIFNFRALNPFYFTQLSNRSYIELVPVNSHILYLKKEART